MMPRTTPSAAELLAEIRQSREDAALDLSWTEKIHDAVGDAFEGDDQ